MRELKPCPFCGGVAGVDKTNYYFEDTGEHAMSAFVVQCRSCGMKTAQYRTEESAIKRWNRRAERTCRAVLPPYEPGVEEIHVCSGCGRQLLLEDDDEYCPRCGAKLTEDEVDE